MRSKTHLKSIRNVARAIIFDMDGVITNTMPYHFKAWKQIFREAGVRVSKYDVYRREGQRGITSLKEIFSAHNKSFNVKNAQELLARKEELFKRIVRSRFIPGAKNFIKFLHRQGFELALVTGTSRHELHRILPDEIYNSFKVVVTGTDVRNGKPHPEPFLLALKRLRMKAADGIVIENAPFGIQAAKAAGLRCIALATSLPRKYLNSADHVFLSVKEMRTKIDFIAQGKNR